MKGKLLAAGVGVALLAVIVMTLMNNKAKSKAQADQSELSTVLPVTATVVQKARLEEDVTLIGSILPNNEVVVLSETSGRIKSMNIRIGSSVSAGSVLCAVDDELRQAGLLSAQANYDKAKADFDRTEALFAEKAVAEAQMDGAKLGLKAAEAQLIIARRQLKDTKITAPISGQVTARSVDVGATLAPGAPVCTIVDISTLKVRLNVAEADVFKLAVGDQVRISVDVYPGVEFTGRVAGIAAKGDEAHTYPVEVAFPNSAKYPLRAGMFARAAFTTIERAAALAIPREALVGSVKDAAVFVVENGATARLRKIVVGAENAGKLTITSGLNEGETIVVTGQNNLKDGANVSVVK
jgi:RND family efflux transporter MFP subunit